MAVRFAAFVLAAMAFHFLFAGLRIDDSMTLRPDSAEYLIGSRALAGGRGYRDLSQPNSPALFRPIGTSVILLPVTATRGFDIRASKFLILALGTLSILVVALIARRLIGAAAAILLAMLMSTSCLFLIYDTQILSEIPYTLFTLLLLLLMIRSTAKAKASAIEPQMDTSLLPSVGSVTAMAILALAAEKTRSMGIVLWPALLIWSLLHPNRKSLAALVIAGFAISNLLDRPPFRESASSGPYMQMLKDTYGELKPGQIASVMVASARQHLACFASLISPSFWPDLGIDLPIPGSNVLRRFAPLLGLFVLITAAVGLKIRAKQTGIRGEVFFVVLYSAGTIVLLLIWPRMSRLAFPLLPILAIYFWLAIFRAPKFLCACIVCLAILGHAASLFRWITAPSVADPTWSDWQKVGHWLRENSDRNSTRVLAADKYLFLYSDRLQPDVGNVFSLSASANDINRTIQETGANYLRFGGWYDDPVVQQNPCYRFTVVDTGAVDEPLLKIDFNQTGEVQLYPILKPMEFPKTQDGRPLLPELSLQIARRLQARGKLNDAKDLLASVLKEADTSAPYYPAALMLMGDALLDSDQPTEAIASFEKVLKAESVDLYGGAARNSIQVARTTRQADNPSTRPGTRGEIHENLALGHAAMCRWPFALRHIDKAIAADPDRLSAKLIKASFERKIEGHKKLAEKALLDVIERLKLEVPNAEQRNSLPIHKDVFDQWLLLQAKDRVLVDKAAQFTIKLDGKSFEFDAKSGDAYLELVKRYQADGLDGVAHAILEQGLANAPSHAGLRHEKERTDREQTRRNRERK